MSGTETAVGTEWTGEPLDVIVESLRERILDSSEANEYVLFHSEKYLQHFLTSTKEEVSEKVREELLCQYQCQIWFKILTAVAKAF